MRIVYIAYNDIPGTSAAGVHVMRMAQALADQGHDVVLLVSPAGDAALRGVAPHDHYGTRRNFSVQYVAHSRLPNLGRLAFAVRAVKETARLSPDLVYGRDLLSAALSVLVGFQTVYEVHHPIHRESRLKRALLRWMGKSGRLGHVVAISESLARVLECEVGIGRDRVVVAHDACDDPSGDIEAAAIKDSNGRSNVGYIGSLHPGKGLEVVVQVAARAPEVFFHIVGGSAEQVEYWRARTAAANVHFYGRVPPREVMAYVRAMDICLLPNQPSVLSRGGNDIADFTSPLKMFEYMAAAKPIVCSDLPVLREVLDPTTAVLVRADDWPRWSEEIVGLANDEARREQLGRAARQRFLGRYTWYERVRHVLPGGGSRVT